MTCLTCSLSSFFPELVTMPTLSKLTMGTLLRAKA
jgi:hypothetical protein